MDEPKSRSEKKREAKRIEELARDLAGLSGTLIAGLPVEEPLRDEIRAAAAVRAHGARKRQVKHLARVLRRGEPAVVDALAAHLGALRRSRVGEAKKHRRLERLRDRILDPETSEAALEEALRDLPGIDRDGLRTLAARAHREHRPRHGREIFRRLKAAADRLEHGAPPGRS